MGITFNSYSYPLFSPISRNNLNLLHKHSHSYIINLQAASQIQLLWIICYSTRMFLGTITKQEKPWEYHIHQTQQVDQDQKKRSQATPAAATRPQPPELALRCPRCDSTNTKFCYYNNYSLTQPRYFCKSCRRYWTKGGTLRNIPVGGGCRKNKRSTSSATRSLRTTPEPASHDGKAFSAASFGGYNNNEQIDLSLAFALLNKQPSGSSAQLGFPSEFGSSHQSDMEGVFGTNQPKGNASYAFGNGSSGLDIGMGDPSRVLWGFPWQMNGESFGMMNIGAGGGHVDQIDSGREIWTNMNYINSGALM